MRESSRAISRSRRIVVTFVGFLVIASFVSSISICIDAYSLEVWDELTDVGPTAMVAHGPGIEAYVEDIAELASVTAVSVVQVARAYLRMDQNEVYQGSPDDPIDPTFMITGNAYSLNDDFASAFPDEFEIVMGRYPQNSSEIAIPYGDAAHWAIPLGRMMNYTHTLNGVKHTVFVVGFFQQTTEDALDFYSQRAIAVVTEDVLNSDEKESKVFVNIERSHIGPEDPRGSLRRLKAIQRSIQQLHPDFSAESPYSLFLVDSKLISSVESYLGWIDATRLNVISRSHLEIILVGLIAIVATGINLRARREHDLIVLARGASTRRIVANTLAELIATSTVAFVVGTMAGMAFSRIGHASSGFLILNYPMLQTGTSLLTADTIQFMLMAAILLPIVSYILQIRREEDVLEEPGRLGRISRQFKEVRWDLGVVAVCITLALVSGSLDSTLKTGTPFALVLLLLPFVTFLGLASLLRKSYSSLSGLLSRALSSFVGRVNAITGMRVSTGSSHDRFMFVLVLSLVVIASFNYSISSTTIPVTAEAQMHYTIGGDLILQLDQSAEILWNTFAEQVENMTSVTESSLVSTGQLSLAEGSSGQAIFAAVEPSNFGKIGYSQNGIQLNKSAINSLLIELDLKPDGAIITSDIAAEYELVPGDSLRVFALGPLQEAFEFRILGIANLLPIPRIVESTTSASVLGTNAVWLNRDYLNNHTSLVLAANNFLCAKASSNANSTTIVQSLLQSNSSLIYQSRWSSVEYEMEQFEAQSNYIIEQSLNTVCIILFPLIMGYAYAITSILIRNDDVRKRSILRALGMSSGGEIRLAFAEALSFIALSLFMLLLFGTTSIHLSLDAAQMQYSIWSIGFPITRVLSVSISELLAIALVLFLPMLLLTGIGTRTMRIRHLYAGVSADWTVANHGGSE